MTDTYRHKGLRKQLAQLLAEKGITNTKVLKAIENIPRHLFIPDNALHKFAYEDKPFPIGSKQTISQPYTVAFQTETLDIKNKNGLNSKIMFKVPYTLQLIYLRLFKELILEIKEDKYKI